MAQFAPLTPQATLKSSLPTTARAETMDRLEREAFDLVVIGGGISGAGVAREAAQRGLRVALLESDDFAVGTSSRSSKLIHGGLRYLAMGDVALVRKTALERKEIFRLAPHLAVRRWMVVPTRSVAGMLKMRAAISLYEMLGNVEREDRHHNWKLADMAREEPLLDREVFKNAIAYREYLTDDAHLVLANLRAAAGFGAAVLNHAEVRQVVSDGGRAVGVEAVCRFTERRIRVRARCVVNAAGPWVEAIRRLEDVAAPPLLHLSKGVHIVVPATRLPIRNILFLETEDKRSIFVIRRGECVYIGTTDTTYDDGSDLWPPIDREDVEYLLRAPSRALDVDPLRPEDVIGAWAGLRPLIAQPGKAPGEISRRDEILVGPARVITLAGGKLTGFRLMAKEAVEKAAEVTGLELMPAPVEEAPLPGGDFDGSLERLEKGLVVDSGVSPVCAARLVRLYGTEAREVVRSGVEPLVPDAPVLAAEVAWAVQVEAAATVEDVVYRRLRTAFYTENTREASIVPVADAMAKLLGWTEERKRREVAGVRARLAEDLSFLNN